MSFNFTLSILSILLLLGSSCAQKKSKEEAAVTPNNNEYNFTTPMRVGEKLSSAEYTIAKNICESFEAMQSRLHEVGGRVSLKIKVRNKTCSQQNDSGYDADAHIISSRGSGVTLSPVSRTTRTFTDVLSTEHPRLLPFCQSVLAGINPNNTVKNGSFRYQVTFFEADNFEWVQIVEFKSVNDLFMPYVIEKSAIITPYANVNRENLGFTRSRTINTPCSNNQAAYQFQLWL